MRLREHEKCFSLRFDNGVSVDVGRDGETFTGLGAVALRRRKLRSAELAILPLIRMPDGYHVARLALRDIRSGDETITLELTPFVTRLGMTEWSTGDGEGRWNVGPWSRAQERDRGGGLSVTLAALSRTIGGVDFTGFSYAYTFRSRKYHAYRLHDRATWELGGRATGNSFWMAGPFNEPRKLIRNRADRFSTASWDAARSVGLQFLPLFGALQGFTFQFNANGLLVTAFERPFHCRSLFQKSPGRNYLVHWHQLCGDLSGLLKFPPLQVLYAEGSADERERVDQYCAIRDELYEHFCGRAGLRRERTVMSGVLVGGGGPRARDAERCLDALAGAGCKRVYVPHLMDDLTPRDDSPRVSAAAVRRMRRLSTRAQQRGVELAASVRECCLPWVEAICAPEDEPVAAETPLFPDALHDAQARERLIAHMVRLRGELGIDAVYCDGLFCGVGHEFRRRWSCVDADGARRRHQANHDARYHDNGGEILSLQAALTALTARLQSMGYGWPQIGATGMAGIQGGPNYAAARGSEFMFRDRVMPFPLAGVPDGQEALESYFQGCANRVALTVTCDAASAADNGLEGWWGRDFAAVNHAYNAVSEYMEHSALLANGRGILWRSADPEVRVLWSYREFEWPVGEQAEVFDVIASRPLALSGDTAHVEAWRVYLVQDAADL